MKMRDGAPYECNSCHSQSTTLRIYSRIVDINSTCHFTVNDIISTNCIYSQPSSIKIKIYILRSIFFIPMFVTNISNIHTWHYGKYVIKRTYLLNICDCVTICPFFKRVICYLQNAYLKKYL